MSRVIPGQGSDTWQRWDAPSVVTDGRPPDEGENARLPTEQELQELREAAFQEGFTAGHAEGMVSGRQEVDAQAQLFRDLMAALARPFEELDLRVEEELVALVIALVRQLVRREIRTDSEVVLGAVREALNELPVSSHGVTVQLHPDDAAIVHRVFAETEPQEDWKIAENPALTRGGCLVVTETSQIDVTVERRLSAAIRRVFGGDRGTDSPRTTSATPTHREAS